MISFDIDLLDVRTINLVTLEADFTQNQLLVIKDETLTTPVIRVFSLP